MELLFLTRPYGHVRIKYSVFVKSNLLNIKYAFNFNFISLYDSNFAFIYFNILLLFSKLYKFRSIERSLYYYLLSLITTIELIILALMFLIFVELIKVLLRIALLYIYISVYYNSHIFYLFIVYSFEIK